MGVDDIVKGFTLAGVLDADSKAKGRWPVVEADPAELLEHPANSAYSMDEAAVRKLADSIRESGLTDIPLARRLPDGSLQMLSGHRRRAAWLLLAGEDPSFARMPVRVVDGVDDQQALMILHSANYFIRELTAVERAAATRALEPEVERLRDADPEVRGMRTEDVKAAILTAQTGKKVSGRTVRRAEDVAGAIDGLLVLVWANEARLGVLSDSDVMRLAGLSASGQEALYAKRVESGMDAKATSDLIRKATAKAPEPKAMNLAKRASRALETLASMEGVELDDAMARRLAAAMDSVDKTVLGRRRRR